MIMIFLFPACIRAELPFLGPELRFQVIFYRMISVQHATAQELTVTSDVQWMSQNVKHEISLQSVLGDYQKVKTAT